ncbi:MAG: hypothetical protein AAB834_06465 [Patescibacteria group bacterium]
MFSVAIKIAVVVLLIKELWLLLQIPSVADAVVSFVMVGQVPGTARILSPDEMIRLLAGVAILASCLIFRKELVGLARRTFKHSNQTALLPQAITPITRPRFASTAKPQAAYRHKMFQLLQTLKERTNRRAFIVQASLRNIARRISEIVIQISGIAWKHVKAIVGYAWKLALILYLLSTLLLVRIWQWLEPHLHSFDRWLDNKLHQNEHTAALLSIGSDISATMKRWMEEARSLDDEDIAAHQTRK